MTPEDIKRLVPKELSLVSAQTGLPIQTLIQQLPKVIKLFSEALSDVTAGSGIKGVPSLLPLGLILTEEDLGDCRLRDLRVALPVWALFYVVMTVYASNGASVDTFLVDALMAPEHFRHLGDLSDGMSIASLTATYLWANAQSKEEHAGVIRDVESRITLFAP